MTVQMKYNQKLPKKIEKQLDAYIERIKRIQWFKVNENLDMSLVEEQIKLSLKAFGVEAKIEYRDLKTMDDFNAACAAAWDAGWDASRGAARDAVQDAVLNKTWNAAWEAAREAAREAAWGAARAAVWDAAQGAARNASRNAAKAAADLLALNTEDYKKKYPKGNYINLIPLWEMGLYPCGVVNGTFICYIPKK